MKQPLKVYIDQGANLKKLRTLQARELITLLQSDSLEQQFRGVRKQGRAFTIGVSIIGGLDMIAGDNISDISIEMGHNNSLDFNHIYAAHLNSCDYFITENSDDFIKNGKREKLEKMLNIKIRRTEEFIEELKK